MFDRNILKITDLVKRYGRGDPVLKNLDLILDKAQGHAAAKKIASSAREAPPAASPPTWRSGAPARNNIEMTITLISPIAVEEGLKFSIREGGRTVGAGSVIKIIK